MRRVQGLCFLSNVLGIWERRLSSHFTQQSFQALSVHHTNKVVFNPWVSNYRQLHKTYSMQGDHRNDNKTSGCNVSASCGPQRASSDSRWATSTALTHLQTLLHGSPKIFILIALLRATSRLSTLTSFRSEEHTSELQSQSNLVCRL